MDKLVNIGGETLVRPSEVAAVEKIDVGVRVTLRSGQYMHVPGVGLGDVELRLTTVSIDEARASHGPRAERPNP